MLSSEKLLRIIVYWALQGCFPTPVVGGEAPDEGVKDKSFGFARPHPAFGHPLPEGEGPRFRFTAQLRWAIALLIRTLYDDHHREVDDPHGPFDVALPVLGIVALASRAWLSMRTSALQKNALTNFIAPML